MHIFCLRSDRARIVCAQSLKLFYTYWLHVISISRNRGNRTEQSLLAAATRLYRNNRTVSDRYSVIRDFGKSPLNRIPECNAHGNVSDVPECSLDRICQDSTTCTGCFRIQQCRNRRNLHI